MALAAGEAPAREQDARLDRIAVRAIAAGAAIRVVYGLVLHPPLHYTYSDMGGYVARAQRLASAHEVPRSDYFMPFGTQALLALPMRVFGTGRPGLWAAAVLWCALSCLFPLLAWRWARTFLSPRGAMVVAVGCALSPLAIIYGGYFSSELPAIVLLPAALLALEGAVRRPGWGSALAAGVLAVALLAVRQQFALNLAVAGIALIVTARQAVCRAAPRLIAGAAAGVLLVVVAGAAPWAVQGGRLPPLAGQNGGVNFFYGHCDVHTLTMADLYFQSPVRVEAHTGRDVHLPGRRSTDQGYLYRQGLDCITRSPARAAVLAARSAADMTVSAIPFPPYLEGGAVMVIAESANTVFCLLLVALVVAAVRRARHDGVAAVLLTQLLCAFAVAVVFLGEPRYRMPYDLFGWALLGWWVTRAGSVATTTPAPPP